MELQPYLLITGVGAHFVGIVGWMRFVDQKTTRNFEEFS